MARIRAQVASRSAACERWMPLWRSLIANQGDSPDLRQRVATLRQHLMERLSTMYELELSTLSEMSRRHLLIALEALTDVESWGRMQEYFGLPAEEAREVWVRSIDRLLPATPVRP